MSYIHGFDEIEQKRLVTQAAVLDGKVFEKIDFQNPKRILEVGSGVGAQTEILLSRFPDAHITGIELSEIQFNTSKAYLETKFDASRYTLVNANAEQMPFEENTFDAIYICWVLEHVPNPQRIIDECYRVMDKGGIISITEVQNNNLYVVPHSPFLKEYWDKYNELQLEMGGNPFVGIEIGNFIYNAGFQENRIYAQTFLYDNIDPERRDIMIEYWTNLMLSGLDNLIEHGKANPEDRQRIIDEMTKAKQDNGVFHYAFIQAEGKK